MSIASAIAGDDQEGLLLMLQRRQGASKAQGDTQHPKPLRKLEFGSDSWYPEDDPVIANFSSTYWPNYLDEARRLLGPEGELIWYGRVVTEEGVLGDRVVYQDQNDAELDDKIPSQCDEEICILRSVQKALELRVALVCQERNTFAPINTLPPELLVNIFSIATRNNRITVSSDNAALSLVCRYWNSLVSTTPSLWARVDEETMSVAMIIRAIEKSQNAPLELVCTWWALEQAKRDAMLNELFRHTHRWREVSLALGDIHQPLDVINTSSMPLLESLSLSVHGYPGWVRPEPLDLFGGRPPPRLQKLYIGGIPVAWNPTTLCHLTTLSMSQIRQLGPSLEQLMAVLSACLDLESLSISEVSFSGGASTSSPNPIHMPALKSLVFRTLTTEITNILLASIHAPNCISGELYCDVLGDPLQTLFTSEVSHFFDHIRSHPSTGSITCVLPEFYISRMGPWNLTLSVKNITFAKDTLIWLSSSSPIRIAIHGLNMLTADILAVIADTEALYQISFGSEAPVSDALTLLATYGSVPVSTPSGWPFPGLEEMSIAGDIVGDDWERLLLMLQRRQGAPETQGDAQHPKPLRRLVFGLDWPGYHPGADEPVIANFSSIYWPNRLDEVRRLLGPEGELKWHGKVVTEEGVLED
ncbi:hypothetical protein FRC04_000820 [Tulasnella sp. 424]|nr:hypothetical protein FRC04_000820 [Tulasnella sp. 424]